MNTIDSTRICFTLLKTDFISRLFFLHRLLQQPEHRQVTNELIEFWCNELIEFWCQDQETPTTVDIIVLLTELDDEAKITEIHAYLNSIYQNNEDEMRQDRARLDAFTDRIKTHPDIHTPLIYAYNLLVTTNYFSSSQEIADTIKYIADCIAYYVDELNSLNDLKFSLISFELEYNQTPEEYRQQQQAMFNDIRNDLINYLEDINTNLIQETWVLSRNRLHFFNEAQLKKITSTFNYLKSSINNLLNDWEDKLTPLKETCYLAG